MCLLIGVRKRMQKFADFEFRFASFGFGVLDGFRATVGRRGEDQLLGGVDSAFCLDRACDDCCRFFYTA